MKQGTPAHGKDNKDYIHTAEFLAWKRLQVSKAKLSTITEIATLLAGFAVVSKNFISYMHIFFVNKKKSSNLILNFILGGAQVATVELQVNSDANPYLLTAFGVTTALLCTSSMMAVMISTCILPYIQTVVKVGKDPKESPHEEMSW
jgi:calcium release-activated calcium channel protein 1